MEKTNDLSKPDLNGQKEISMQAPESSEENSAQTSFGNTFNKKLILLAFLSYIPGFLYTYIFTDFFCYQILESENIPLWATVTFIVFVGLFVFMTEYLFKAQKHASTSWFWMLTFLLSCLSLCFRFQVWKGWNILLIHGFAIYYVLARSNKLMAYQSSSYILIDVFHGVFSFPFTNLLKRIKTVFQPGKEKNRSFSLKTVLWITIAAVFALILLVLAAESLSSADDNYSNLISDLTKNFEQVDLSEFLLRLLFSIPIGAYIFGLLFGTDKKERIALDAERKSIDFDLSRLHHIPLGVWTAIAAVFSLFYLAFYIIQANYLFSALRGILPEGFTAANYARQGFFELCRVIIINFILIFMIKASSKESVQTSLPLKTVLTLITIESILFAVISGSKLALYISRFGLTSLRIMSFWLVVTLAAACIAYLIHLWANKKTFRVFFIFSIVILLITEFIWIP